MTLLKNRRAWKAWSKAEFHSNPPTQPPKEFPCFAIGTRDGPYYLYRSEVQDMSMKLALNAMESPI